MQATCSDGSSIEEGVCFIVTSIHCQITFSFFLAVESPLPSTNKHLALLHYKNSDTFAEQKGIPVLWNLDTNLFYSAAYCANFGRVFCCGGDGGGRGIAAVYMLAQDDSVKQKPFMNGGRYVHGLRIALLIQDCHLYVFRGFNSGTFLKTCERFVLSHSKCTLLP